VNSQSCAAAGCSVVERCSRTATSSSRRSRASGRGSTSRLSQRATVRGLVCSTRARSCPSSSIRAAALPSRSATVTGFASSLSSECPATVTQYGDPSGRQRISPARDDPGRPRARAGAGRPDPFQRGAHIPGAVVEAVFARIEAPLIRRLIDHGVPRVVDPQTMRFVTDGYLSARAPQSGPTRRRGRQRNVFHREKTLACVPRARWPGTREPRRTHRRACRSPDRRRVRSAGQSRGDERQCRQARPLRRFLLAVRRLQLPVVAGRVGAFGLLLEALDIPSFDSGLGQAEGHVLATLNRPRRASGKRDSNAAECDHRTSHTSIAGSR
jgi:hypothetical protein